VDEAFWLLFLFTHFGHHGSGGWQYQRAIYGSLGDGSRWDWIRVSSDPAAFRKWLSAHEAAIKSGPARSGFGNHRKYQSLSGTSPVGTGAAVESYVQWVGMAGSHAVRFAMPAGTTPEAAFDALFRSMALVRQFGRVARFDYLTIAGRLGFAAVRPGLLYLAGSTGPIKAARLLYGAASSRELEARAVSLADALGVGTDVMEDALCNWQKSPSSFIPFRD
jgi:Alpha-glutamyl/putrescinyl thymine pyrophosphorylase clade 3